jgi:antitoxin ParD1/3/4
MATMNISLPDEMKDWVEKQAATGSYSNVSDYVRDVLRREQGLVTRLQGLVDEARDSGVVDMSPAELLEDIKRRSREKVLATADEIRSEAIKTDDAA